MSWFLTFAGLALLIILHEFGHFAAAKAVGMRVEKFSLFFGPMLVKFRRGETVYGVGPIPLGGYVKITGMNPQEQVPPEVAPRSYFRAPVWKRVAVISAGPAMNILLAFLILWVIFLSQGSFSATDTIKMVDRHQPAAGVLRPGDQVVAVDGRRGSLQTLSDQIASHRCPGAQTNGCAAATPVRITLRRQGQLITVSLLPRYDASSGRARVGFGFEVVHHQVGPVRAVDLSLSQMWGFTADNVSGLAKVFFSSHARAQIHSVVGISDIARQEVSYGVLDAVWFLALISVWLGVINLFPFLPLDGGHIFWALGEKVRRRPISFRFMQQMSAVGIVLILFLVLTGLTNDISSLNNGGLHVPR